MFKTRQYWLIVLLLGLCHCTDDDIVINVHGLTADVQALTVRATLNGMVAKAPQDITQNLNQFVVRLPQGSAGQLVVDVGALGSDQCKLGSGQVSAQVMPGSQSLTQLDLTLAPLPTKLCTIRVTRSGDGSVSSQPAGLVCDISLDVCDVDFPSGTPVTLTGLPGPTAYSVSWSGACTGTSTCSLTAAGRQQVTAAFAARFCSPEGWCWQNPLPSGSGFKAVWGTATNNLWAVGLTGTILHYDGQLWTPVASGTSQDLLGVWGSGASDVYAVGNGGTVLHYDGMSWTAVQTPATGQLPAVWGSGASDVWASASGMFLHYDGTAWTMKTSGSANLALAIWGTAANNVYAVGQMGTIFHYDGNAWTGQTGPVTSNLNGLWGSGPNDAWAVGDSGATLYFNGSQWTATTPVVTMNLSHIWGSAQNDYWAVGDQGVILRRGGPTWVEHPRSRKLVGNYLAAVFGTSDADVWAVGSSGARLHFTQAQNDWSIDPTAGLITTANFGRVWGSSTSDVWAISPQGQIAHFDGRGWSAIPAPAGAYYDIWGSAPNDIWTVGLSGFLIHYDGGGWTMANSGTVNNLFGVWGSAKNDVWIVGDKGTLLHNQGGGFIADTASGTITTSALLDVSGSGSGDVWAVGDNPTVLHYSAGAWATVSLGGLAPATQLRAVWRDSAMSTVFIAGLNGVSLQLVGTTWTALPNTNSANYGVWGSSPTDVWMAGQESLQHYDGQAWKASGPAGMYGLWEAGPKDMWAVGYSGFVLRYQH